MEFLHWVLDTIRNPGALIELGGAPGLALIVFLETGAMVFFLPGDSLLVTAGLYSANGTLNVWLLNLILIPCAILGDTTSYWIGKKIGPRIFNRPKSRFFNPEHVKAAHRFYEKHGGKAIIIARFMPLVRTFVPVVAGVAGMSYPRFLTYNVVGGIAWVTSMTFVGYFLGQIPFFKDHIEKVIIAVVVISVMPMVIEFVRAKLRARSAAPAPVQSAPSNEG